MSDTTQFVNAVNPRDPGAAAEDLLPLVHDELRRILVDRARSNREPSDNR
jgi:hypothetical protein